MDAREGPLRRVGGDDAITTRLGAAALPLGIIVLVVSEVLHPSREDPMDNPAVFAEYADSDIWTSVHSSSGSASSPCSAACSPSTTPSAQDRAAARGSRPSA